MTRLRAMTRWPAIVLAVLVSSCTARLPGDDVVRDAGQGPTDAPMTDAGPRCPSDPVDRDDETVDADTEITTDTTWDCTKNWLLQGPVIVSSGTLTIEAGVRVRVADGGFLLIGQDARIEAIGTRDAPIVLQPRTRPAARAQWRGLVMLGKARTGFSSTTRVRETVADGRGAFGGADDTHDCGHLEYVRIEFAGGSPTALNDYFIPASGLTLAGCGRGTVVDHVQVHRGADGIGLIGGMAPIRHVLVTDPDEDGIEWAAGYRGLVQFAIVQTFPGSGGAIKGSREEGEFEGDPESEPVVFNVTLAGSQVPNGSPINGFESGVLFQVGTLGFVRNALVQGFSGYWANAADAETAARFPTGRVGISHTLFFERASAPRGAFPPGTPPEDEDGDFDEDAEFRQAALSNRFPSTGPILRAPYEPAPMRPDFTADPTISSGVFATEPSGWVGVYEAADYYGAIAPSDGSATERERVDWTLSWTDFPTE